MQMQIIITLFAYVLYPALVLYAHISVKFTAFPYDLMSWQNTKKNSHEFYKNNCMRKIGLIVTFFFGVYFIGLFKQRKIGDKLV